MELHLKNGVVTDVTFELALVLGWIKAEWEREELGEFVVTSLKDGTHTAGSQHHQDVSAPGEAADIRTRHLYDEQSSQHEPRLVAFARRLQAAGLKVIVHPDWLPSMPVPPHLHVGIGAPILRRVP